MPEVEREGYVQAETKDARRQVEVDRYLQKEADLKNGAKRQAFEAEEKSRMDQNILKEKEWEGRALAIKLRDAEELVKRLRGEWRVVYGEIENAKIRAIRSAEYADTAERMRAKVELNFSEARKVLVQPTPKEIEEVKRVQQYTEGLFHVAVLGNSGYGKTSLINAMLRMEIPNTQAATTIHAREITPTIARYRVPRGRFVWYEIPAPANGDTTRTYFKDHGLYIFDAILILIGDKLTDYERLIIRNCDFRNIPYFLVRSKTDQEIWATCKEYGISEGDARATFTKRHHRNIRESLKVAGLPETEIYLISNLSLYHKVAWPRIARSDILDEELFIRDIWKCAYENSLHTRAVY